MKRVLLATTNVDKYNAVSLVFKNTIFPEDKYIIEGLFQLDEVIKDEKEEGNNIERARRKAMQVFEELKNNTYDYIVGLDDAIRVKGRLEPSIKQYLNKILYENYIEDGDEYSFNRAYCILDKNGTLYETNIDIPYIYHSTDSFELEEHSYPLSKVAYPIGYDKPICELNEKEEVNYYLSYVKDKLMDLNI